MIKSVAKISHWICLFLTYSIFCLFISSTASSQVITPNGELNSILMGDSQCFNIPSNYYNETWKYHILLDQGFEVQLSFTINELGSFQKRVTGTQIRVIQPNGKTLVLNKEYHPHQLIFNSDGYFIKMHENRAFWATELINNRQELLFNTRKNKTDILLDLTLFDAEPGQVWGDGVFKIGKDSLFLEYLIPDSKVKGIIAINNDTAEVSGRAIMTHSYKTDTAINKINFEVIYWDKATRPSFLSTLFSIGKSELVGYGLAASDKKMNLLIPDEFKMNQYKKVRNFKLPADFFVSYNNSGLKHQFELTKVNNHYTLLDELSSFTKFLARQFLKKEILDIETSGKINREKPVYADILTSETY